MKQKGIMGLPITEPSLREYQDFLKEVKKLGYDLENGILPYTRNISFNGEPCILCGGTKLIHGIGRYVIYDIEQEQKGIPICGFCSDFLEKTWKIKMDFG